jgi:hypothetical protein
MDEVFTKVRQQRDALAGASNPGDSVRSARTRTVKQQLAFARVARQ